MICNDKICLHNLLLIAILNIAVYGYIIQSIIKTDILENKFADCEGCDYWAFTHFILYVILAYNFPSYYILLFLVGVTYEYIEYLIGATDNPLKFLGPIGSDGDQTWWYGIVSDIIFNTLGIFVGLYLSPYPIKNNKYIIF